MPHFSTLPTMVDTLNYVSVLVQITLVLVELLFLVWVHSVASFSLLIVLLGLAPISISTSPSTIISASPSVIASTSPSPPSLSLELLFPWNDCQHGDDWDAWNAVHSGFIWPIRLPFCCCCFSYFANTKDTS